jgi:hypothetical protein
VIKCEDGEHCETMFDMLDHQDDSRRGFSGVTTINLKTGTCRYIGVRYCKSGKGKDRGVMLNFCPFCGASLQWWEQ